MKLCDGILLIVILSSNFILRSNINLNDLYA